MTTGQINDTMVEEFYECLEACEGDKRGALTMAFEKYSLNAADSTTEQDSWHEAIARF